MSDLDQPAVAAMARALGLAVPPDDLPEVTHRLNAFIAALRPLAALPLDAVEPVPAPVDPDTGR